MEDDHVDRLGVQARQRVELTSTNRSIGLIALMVHVREPQSKRPFANNSASWSALSRPSRDERARPFRIEVPAFGDASLTLALAVAQLELEFLGSSPRMRSAPLRLFFAGPVVRARRPKPDPIPNSAVKRLSANGTVSQDPGE